MAHLHHDRRELHRHDLEPDRHQQRIDLSSPAFEQGGEIPARYSCEGPDVSPPLRVGATPKGTRSLILAVDDPDAPDPAAPEKRFVHWVIYNLPPDTRELPEAMSVEQRPPGACEGRNDFGRIGYSGPCPPVRRHRYFFTVYALDKVLEETGALTRDEILRAAQGHILAQGELVGVYEKKEPTH